MDVRQGEIYWVDIPFKHTEGSEQAGRRPFIVVSRDAVNKTLKTVVAVPMSSNVNSQAPYRIVIPVSEITKDISCNTTLVLSVAKTDQVRVIDKSRLKEKIGRLSQTATISVVLGLGYVFNIR
jgi:mRNA interferase MazF